MHKKPRILLLSAILLAVLLQVSPGAAEDAPMSRDASLINAFQIMCQLEPLDFERLDARATAMHMQVQHDATNPSANDTTTRSKAWSGSLKTGPFALMADDMKGPKGVSTACSIVGGVPDVGAFQSDLIKTLHLDASAQTGQAPGGTEWIIGAGSKIILRNARNNGQQAVMVKLVTMKAAE